jgi:hypothetical protein
VSAEIARPFAELRWTGVFAGNVPGDAEVEEPADLSHVRRRERVPGVKRSRRCIFRTA